MADTLEVISKSIELMHYTYCITSNVKRYTKKYIMLVQEIQKVCMHIYKNLMYANRMQLYQETNQRLNLQSKAITLCDELSCYVQLSMDLNLIGSKTVNCWQEKISAIKYMTIAWRSKDKDRTKQ